MKKWIPMFLWAALVVSAAGCGSAKSEENVSKYTSAVEVLDTVVGAYEEEEKFPMAGGDLAHTNMEGPGAFDVTLTEELVVTLGLPEGETEQIDDAASVMHMMNANLFTGAAYHLKTGTDVEKFAEAVKEEVLKKQWICGMPDTLIVVDVDGQYVVTAYGADEIIKTFEKNALSALEGSEVILNTPVIE